MNRRYSSSEASRKARMARELVLEGIGVLHEAYGLDELRHFNDLVRQSRSFEEVRLAADMLLVMGMFADLRMDEEYDDDGDRDSG